MEVDRSLYETYLEEMQGLERFRHRYGNRYPDIPLESDDPDTRRLMEAMALFSARTRSLTEEKTRLFHFRMLARLFGEFIQPLPASIQVAFQATGLAEQMRLPAGTRLGVSDGEGDLTLFRTEHPVVLHPMAVRETLLSKNQRRLDLTFDLSYPHTGPLKIPLTLHTQGDLITAAALYRQLAGCTGTATPDSGESLPVTVETETIDTGEHPILALRDFFHDPASHLRVILCLPEIPQGCRRLAFALYSSIPWPDLCEEEGTFMPMTARAKNRITAHAAPILHDGTRQRHPLRAPDPLNGSVPLAVNGVYTDSSEGLVPLQPEYMDGGGQGYALDLFPKADGLEVSLRLALPEAFHRPVTVVAEADWYRPDFRRIAWKQLALFLYDHEVPGVTPILCGPPSLQRVPDAAAAAERLPELAAWKHAQWMHPEEINELMERWMGAWSGPFRDLKPIVGRLSLDGSGAVPCCEVAYTAPLGRLAPLATLFEEGFVKTLDAWIMRPGLKLRRLTPGSMERDGDHDAA
ncbi:type VI secretion system baseplate subunit TssF [Desulfoluna spongiiphila]|uniref:Type VI secretion system, ImpG, VasA, VC_A0110 n=1 Tax=Desulfoluna spongiiphila TaxID=419481 RepID=A0A1G5FIS0_9BACT|nr:type VI secretion system baseplate subunit TssF [Desulfoluna spongiiphila]SCY39185.1 Type VI secretion system, ImpG, VasA, VC_A0110 [Desulfoluna spongiiphila]